MMFSLLSMAQSDYISNSRVDSLDCIMQLDGKRGILLLSRSNNLVITVTNVPDAVINPKGIDHMDIMNMRSSSGLMTPTPNWKSTCAVT